MSFMQFLSVKKQDLSKLQKLAHQIWNEYYPEIIGQNQVDFMLKTLYSLDSLEKQMEEGQQFYLVELEIGKSVGFFAISEKGESEIFIHKFYIDVSIQNRGLGKQTFQFILNEFGAEKIKLQVNRQNFKAINFYFKVGFKIEKVADFDIGDGYFMNDFIMVWQKKQIN